jgi:sugar diacid utilization regulator
MGSEPTGAGARRRRCGRERLSPSTPSELPEVSVVVSRGTRNWPARPTTRPVARRPVPAQPDDFMPLLVRTLWGYRGLGCDLARTASALGVHRSTARYRLYRIRELTGLDPEDPRSVEALRDIAGLHP